MVDKDVSARSARGSTTVVDANLNNLVSEIRTVLQDDPQQPKFVRTVHRVGYAFCGQATDERAPAAVAERDPQGWVIWNERAIAIGTMAAVIGRDPGCAIWIDVPGVSRRHASICLTTFAASATAIVEDLGSMNGTFVEGRRLTRPVTLEDGATIRIGEATLFFRSGASANAVTKRIGKSARRPR